MSGACEKKEWVLLGNEAWKVDCNWERPTYLVIFNDPEGEWCNLDHQKCGLAPHGSLIFSWDLHKNVSKSTSMAPFSPSTIIKLPGDDLHGRITSYMALVCFWASRVVEIFRHVIGPFAFCGFCVQVETFFFSFLSHIFNLSVGTLNAQL